MSDSSYDPQNLRPSPPLAVAAVLFFSTDPESLAKFYREKLAVPLRYFQLPNVAPHWACDIGHVYISIWPTEGDLCDHSKSHRGGMALYVRDVQREYDRLVAQGVPSDFPPTRSALGIIARLRDLDGNPFELYQPVQR